MRNLKTKDVCFKSKAFNDMFKSCPGLRLIHFADDTSAFLSDSDLSRLSFIANNELQKLNGWLNANRLSLNASKSQFMIFSNRAIPQNFSVSINNVPLSRTTSTKFLGVHIDDKLNFRIHVNNVITKINSVRGVLWRNSSVLNIYVKKIIYRSLVFSHLSYAIVVWGRASSVNISKLNAAQKGIIRQIYGTASADIFVSNKILPVEYIHQYFSLVKLFLEFESPNESYFANRIGSFQTNHNYNTRFIDSERLILPSFIKSKPMKFFLYQSITFWNNLPLVIRQSSSVSIFRKRVKEFIFSRIVNDE